MGKLSRFTVQTGETVTAFELGVLNAWRFNGEAARLEDKVDYNFVNGFVDVGDLPCRTATWAEMKTRKTPALEEFDAVSTNLPGFNRRVDFSGFWHLPHRLSRMARCTLIPPATETEPRFQLTTCGGVNIWVDGTHCVAFEPFARNAAHQIDIVLPLKSEGSEIVVLAEEMAERDTSFFFELEWLGDGPLTTTLTSAADPEDIALLMGLARDIAPMKTVFGDGDDLVLRAGDAVSRDVTISAQIGQSVHLSHKPPLFSATTTMRAGDDTINFGSLVDLADAYHPLKLVFSIGESRVERAVGFALLRTLTPTQLAPTLAARKAETLSYLAHHGEARTGRLLAMFEENMPWDDLAQDILDDTLAGINDRRDCSDFVMVPLLWIYGVHGDKFGAENKAKVRDAILNYRYWMDEPGNDAMWFWSENHVLCFHVSELIAGLLFPDETFTNSGITGRAHHELAQKRLERWFASILDHGLAEWNSAAYYPVDLIGLMGVYQWAEGALKQQAKDVLDRLFTMIALHACGSVPAGSMGRAYDKELRAGPLNELAPFAALALGSGWLTSGVAAMPMLCASAYTPPADLGKLAAPEGEIVRASYIQGYGDAGRLSLYKTANMQLSCCVEGTPGATGHQQHLIDVQAAAHPFARAWVNHPGEDDPWGSNRPSYWAGNGTMPAVGMFEEHALAWFDLGHAPRLAFTHAYLPRDAFDETHIGPDWIVARSGNGAVILKATAPIEPVTQGPGKDIEFRCAGAKTGWAVSVMDLEDAEIAPALARARALVLSQTATGMTLIGHGGPELSLDAKGRLSVDGAHVPFATTSRAPVVTFDNPQ